MSGWLNNCIQIFAIPKKSKRYPAKRATVLPVTPRKAWLKPDVLLAVTPATHVRRSHLMSSHRRQLKPEPPAASGMDGIRHGSGILKPSWYEFQQDLCNESLNGKTCLFYSGMLYLARYEKHWVCLKILIILRKRWESFDFFDRYLFANCYS